jgi:hypothetical protein
MFPIHLRAAEVARAALALHREGLLNAQFEPGVMCLRGPRGSSDAIGAGLPQEAADAIRKAGHNGSDIATLVRKGYVTADDKDLGDLATLAVSHDVWSLATRRDPHRAAGMEEDFLRYARAVAAPASGRIVE